MKQFRCSAVVFDLDGVLVDSTTCVERHWHKWADRHGLDRTAILAMSHVKAARLLNVAPEEFVVIEDTPVGIEAARAAQMIVIAVATTRLPAH